MNPIERAVRAVDGWQQRHDALAVPVAVVRKFGDDRAGALAGIIAYYAFVSLFPLLLLLTTLLGFALGRYGWLEERVLDSAAAEFPIIGAEIRDSIQPLRGSGVGLAVGLAGVAWGALGVTQAGQHAMAEVWAVPGVVRPNFWSRLVRGFALFAVLGLGLAGTTALASLSVAADTGGFGRTLLVAGSVAVNVALYAGAFRVMTPSPVATVRLLPGAVLGGVGWTALQTIGGFLVAHQLREASEVYGFFAYVLGLLAWLYLGAQLAMYAAELNVVVARRLWPRSLVQPPLTRADERVLAALVRKEERRPEQRVEVHFADDQNGSVTMPDDPEAPDADAQEQASEVTPEEVSTPPVSVPFEAPEADVLEQAEEVPVDEEP